ncbi:MAG: serine/threonine protein kinase [Planctomycetota bacterium]|jgi:serine/threonine-protein kinase
MADQGSDFLNSLSNLSTSKRDAKPPLDYGGIYPPGKAIQGRYEVVELVGFGGMGVVYKGVDRERDDVVAIKMIRPGLFDSPSAKERFIAEGRTAIELRHPNIVHVRSHFSFDEREFIIMDFIEGHSLREAIHEMNQVGVLDSITIVLQILDALACIHDRGIVHRDMKPENILIDVSRYPVHIWVTDFGISKNMTELKNSLTGAFLGTPDYSAPEQDKDASAVDSRADLFSLGIVFYEMLTGRRPKGAWAAPTQLIPGIPKGLDVLLEKLLQPDPSGRYQNATTARADIGSLLAVELLASVQHQNKKGLLADAKRREVFLDWLETRERERAERG